MDDDGCVDGTSRHASLCTRSFQSLHLLAVKLIRTNDAGIGMLSNHGGVCSVGIAVHSIHHREGNATSGRIQANICV